jgi:ABC-type transport system involved in cytochrome bd biosynthesis fused ATPase/permease subunit
MHPVAIHHPRPHPVFGLLAILLLRWCCATLAKQMLDQLAVRVRAELNGWAFKKAARAGNLGAQLQVGFDATRKALKCRQ